MKRVVIFGAGQAGQMAARWMEAELYLAAYTDNNGALWGRRVNGVPVVEPGRIPDLAPDEVWVAVLNTQAERQIVGQLAQLGYSGPVRSVGGLRQWMDIRLAQVRLLAAELEARQVPGAVAELGVYQGHLAAELNRLFPRRPLYLFDTFCGFDPADLKEEEDPVRQRFADTGVELVRERLPHPEQAVFCQGHFSETMPPDPPDFALVSVDFDLFRPTYEALARFMPLLSPGGMLLVHDYTSIQYPGVKKAVEAYRRQAAVSVIPVPAAVIWPTKSRALPS